MAEKADVSNLSEIASTIESGKYLSQVKGTMDQVREIPISRVPRIVVGDSMTAPSVAPEKTKLQLDAALGKGPWPKNTVGNSTNNDSMAGNGPKNSTSNSTANNSTSGSPSDSPDNSTAGTTTTTSSDNSTAGTTTNSTSNSTASTTTTNSTSNYHRLIRTDSSEIVLPLFFRRGRELSSRSHP